MDDRQREESLKELEYLASVPCAVEKMASCAGLIENWGKMTREWAAENGRTANANQLKTIDLMLAAARMNMMLFEGCAQSFERALRYQEEREARMRDRHGATFDEMDDLIADLAKSLERDPDVG